MDLRTKNAIKWIDALKPEVGFRKTTDRLGRIEEQGKMSYCCLGVACRTMEYTLVDFSAPTNHDLTEDLGLHDAEGLLERFIDDNGNVEKPTTSYSRLSMINDKVFKDDTDFKNIREFILKNIRFIFVRPVADELQIHYTSNE